MKLVMACPPFCNCEEAPSPSSIKPEIISAHPDILSTVGWAELTEINPSEMPQTETFGKIVQISDHLSDSMVPI
jgi:hypothetical protein